MSNASSRGHEVPPRSRKSVEGAAAAIPAPSWSRGRGPVARNCGTPECAAIARARASVSRCGRACARSALLDRPDLDVAERDGGAVVLKVDVAGLGFGVLVPLGELALGD